VDCTNKLAVPLHMTDIAVLEALRSQLLAPGVIEEALSRAASQLAAPRLDEAALWAALGPNLLPMPRNGPNRDFVPDGPYSLYRRP
jgi:hypothetical protein